MLGFKSPPMHRRFLYRADEILAANGDAFRPGRLPATLVLGDSLIDQTPVVFLESFQIRIPENAQTSFLVGQNVTPTPAHPFLITAPGPLFRMRHHTGAN